jgi:TRAP-type C4-dicarboxylate transport system substrate-binding protein
MTGVSKFRRVLAVTLMLLLVLAPAALAKTTLSAHSVYSDAHYQVEALKMMGEKVKELTGGSVEFNVISGAPWATRARISSGSSRKDSSTSPRSSPRD